jgi:hypothetical protein
MKFVSQKSILRTLDFFVKLCKVNVSDSDVNAFSNFIISNWGWELDWIPSEMIIPISNTYRTPNY